MDLRDRFAARFAAALIDVFPEGDEIARRAYDLAEAMLLERERRIDRDERRALAAPPASATALLDEPMPDDEAFDDEPPYDPRWDLDARWSEASALPRGDARGPGLARTQPVDEAEERRERSA